MIQWKGKGEIKITLTTAQSVMRNFIFLLSVVCVFLLVNILFLV